MMATTHAYLAAALAVATLPLTATRAPTTAVLTAAFLGGLAPDLDLVTSHRKTFHFPALGPVAAAAAAAVAAVSDHPAAVVLAVGVAAAAIHAVTDVLSGGLGYAPWEGDSTRAVYNHLLGRWHPPRRLVRYSGAPEDFALGAAFAVPVVLSSATGPLADALLVTVLAATGVYAATRRRFTRLARPVRSRLPAVVVERLPTVRFEER